jgi:uncharacterized iron-regulated membrane protein
MNRARRFWLNLHLWIGLVAGLLLVVLGISGSALVWHDGLDNLLNPERRVAAASAPALPASAYLERAAAALGPGVLPSSLRMPEAPGEAVQVTGIVPAKEGRPRSLTVWLDPEDGRVLDQADNRSSLVGVLHVLHGTLLIPQWSGRQIVGWLGVVMTISTISGLWLWWPRVGSYMKALWWRRGRKPTANLHHVLGSWIALPLLVVSLTGVYISFPSAARALFGPDQAAPSPPPRPPFAARPLERPALPADSVVERARASAAGLRLLGLSLPTERAPVWRVQLESSQEGTVALDVEDGTGKVSRAAPPPRPGGADPVARLMRRLHDGQDMGLAWQVLVFLSGLLPALLWVTGIAMWLRRRKSRRPEAGAQRHAGAAAGRATAAS